MARAPGPAGLWGRARSRISTRHLRAAVTLAVRWGWLPANVVAVASLGRRKTQPRGTLSAEDVTGGCWRARVALSATTRSSRRRRLPYVWRR